jgi:hypothetical protein
MKMNYSRNIDDIKLVALRTAQKKTPDSSTVRMSIYDLTVRALMSELLTLDRINSVMLAVRKGIDEGIQNSVESPGQAAGVVRLEAYRGLCNAADEVLMAIGAGCREFFSLHGSYVSVEICVNIQTDIHIFRQQLEQITHDAQWLTNPEVIATQLRRFQELSACLLPSVKQIPESIVPWAERFFQECKYVTTEEGKNFQACRMLLGMLTHGAFSGLRESQRSS